MVTVGTWVPYMYEKRIKMEHLFRAPGCAETALQ